MQTIIDIFLFVLFSSAMMYLTVIFIITLGWIQLKDIQYNDVDVNTHVSIVVAVRNEENNLPALIKSLDSQDYPEELMEIVFVDDHSSDNTFELMKTYAKGNKQVHCLHSKGEGKKAALKYGFSKAYSELIITTDADCIIKPEWIRSLVSFYEKEKPKIILAPVVYDNEKNILQKFFSLDFISLVASGAGSVSLRLPLMGNAANMAITKDVVMQTGNINEWEKYSSGDDVFLIHYVTKKFGASAVRFLKARSSLVVTSAPDNVKSFVFQRLRWGSKAKGYRLLWPVITAISVFMFNFLLTILAFLGFIMPELWLLFLLFIILKFLIDYPVIKSFSTFVLKRKIVWYLFPFELIYPFYISFIGFFSFFVKYRWKGRKGLR